MDKLDQILHRSLNVEKEDLLDTLSPDLVETWDSMTQFQLIADLESAYGVSFEFEEIFNMRTVGDIRMILELKIENR